VYKLKSIDEFFEKYNETEQLVMMLQEEINFSDYFRCYCVDRKDVRIMQYEPRNPHHLRYVKDGLPIEKKLLDQLKDIVLKINNALGYDFNTVELAMRDGTPYAIDFCNPAPDAELASVGEENFEWVVEAAANMAIRRAQHHKAGMNNLTWGDFVKNYSSGKSMNGKAGKIATSLTEKKPRAKKSKA
jgi:hypothetical protein